MATVIEQTVKYLKQTKPTLLGSGLWDSLHPIGATVPASGIYRCEGCGDEITSNKGDQFPPQNKHQHTNQKKVEWRLIVKTDTQG